jgi:hypothetical protein
MLGAEGGFEPHALAGAATSRQGYASEVCFEEHPSPRSRTLGGKAAYDFGFHTE